MPARLPGLDLLRALAVVWIMLYHVTSYGIGLPALVEYGYMAVDLFFVLSGFLIGGQLLRPYAAGREPVWRDFFVRRALRILPAYLAVLALYFLVPAVRDSPIQPLWQFLTFTQNLFADYHYMRAFSHAWSLCIEEHFYLLLPLAVYLLARRPGAGRVMLLAAGVLTGGMLLRAWLWHSEVAPFLHVRNGEGSYFLRYIEEIYNPTYARLDGLLAGVILAAVHVFRPAWWDWALARRGWFLLAGTAGWGAVMWMPSPGFLSAVVGYPMLSASIAAIVLAAAGPARWLEQVHGWGIGALAAMSFSLYLIHKPVYHVLRPWVAGSAWALPAYAGAALLAGGLLYLLVERPGVRLRAGSMTARLPARSQSGSTLR